MKANRRITFLWDVLFSWGLSVTGTGILVSGYDLDASMAAVSVCCLAVALLACWAQGKKALKWVALCGGVLLFAAWLLGPLAHSLQSLLLRLNAREVPTGANCTWALCALSSTVCITVCRCIAGKLPIYQGLGGLVLPAMCLIGPRAVPDGIWLFSFLGLFSLVLLTQGLRRRAPVPGNRLVATALIPVVFTTWILYIAIPRDGYQMDRISRSLMEQVRTWFREDTAEGPAGSPLKVGGGAISLSNLGDRRESKRTVLTVTAQTGGAMYLRSCAYDTYYGNNWTNLAVPDSLPWPERELLNSQGQVQIQAHGYLDMVLTPYYPMDDTLSGVTRGISNYTDKRSYQYEVGSVSPNAAETALPTGLSAYTQLPAQTKAWANAILRDVVDPGQPVSRQAEAIGNFVSQKAAYTLKPGTMPPTDTDFVRWFLEDNKQGYCVHFASAGAVLLRAAGIPARYVTGYLFTARENEPTEVTGNHAHAWVEYWLPGVGWAVLETTPAAAVSQQLALPEEEAPVAVPEEPEPEEFGFSLPPLWVVFVFFGVVALYILAQWPLRVALKSRRCRKGSSNARALAWWNRLEQLADRLGHPPEEAVESLAHKAAFSPHTLSEEEVQKVKNAFYAAVREAKSRPLFRRVCWRLLLALY